MEYFPLATAFLSELYSNRFCSFEVVISESWGYRDSKYMTAWSWYSQTHLRWHLRDLF